MDRLSRLRPASEDGACVCTLPSVGEPGRDIFSGGVEGSGIFSGSVGGGGATLRHNNSILLSSAS